MDCNLTLYIVALNKKTAKYEILSIDNNNLLCPSSQLKPNVDLKQQLHDLCKKYVAINPSILEYLFLDIHIADSLNVIYFCCIPSELAKTNTYFFIPDNNHAILLQKIIRIF